MKGEKKQHRDEDSKRDDDKAREMREEDTE